MRQSRAIVVSVAASGWSTFEVHLLPIGPDRPRDVADVLKESPTMECLYLPMERAELSYPRPQSTLEIELEVG